MRTYKFRLYPSKEDKRKLEETLELCRQIYNHFLEELNERNDVPPRTELQSQLPNLKNEWNKLNSVHSKVLQMVLHRLCSNLRSLSEKKKNGYKVGRLRFKGKGWFKTFTYNQSGFKVVKTKNRLDTLTLSKIGEVPIRIHREVKGEIKQVTIKRAQSGKWFACIQTDHEENRESGEGVVGIDLNTENYLTDSDGNVVENPRFLEEKEEKLKKEHRKLSRKEKGSKNREKQRIKLGKAYEKLVNCRRDFIHKLTTAYVENYDTIILEDLNIDEMCENSRYAKSNLDASWAYSRSCFYTRLRALV
ncbi:transposase [archaeon SCG-AAA382B04]|nr:transposase [archaeon SCG-AAA382B04]